MPYLEEQLPRLKSLVGQTIVKLELSDDAEVLRFTALDGTQFIFKVDADCCSHTWIQDLLGVDALLSATVTGVEDIPETSDWNDAKDELIRFYSVKVLTTQGLFTVAYRNSSNGYYGGDIDLLAILAPNGTLLPSPFEYDYHYARDIDHLGFDEHTRWRNIVADYPDNSAPLQ